MACHLAGCGPFLNNNALKLGPKFAEQGTILIHPCSKGPSAFDLLFVLL